MRFVVHSALLVHHSAFFRAALTGSFKEAGEKVVKLPHEQCTIVELFVHWLYYHDLPTRDAGDAKHLVQQRADNLIQLHVFSDVYDVPELYD